MVGCPNCALTVGHCTKNGRGKRWLVGCKKEKKDNFCFHGFAKMSLIMAENDNEVFLTAEPSSVSGTVMELVPS